MPGSEFVLFRPRRVTETDSTCMVICPVSTDTAFGSSKGSRCVSETGGPRTPTLKCPSGPRENACLGTRRGMSAGGGSPGSVQQVLSPVCEERPQTDKGQESTGDQGTHGVLEPWLLARGLMTRFPSRAGRPSRSREGTPGLRCPSGPRGRPQTQTQRFRGLNSIQRPVISCNCMRSEKETPTPTHCPPADGSLRHRVSRGPGPF